MFTTNKIMNDFKLQNKKNLILKTIYTSSINKMKKDIKILGLLILFKLILGFSYSTFIVGHFSYMAFTLDFNVYKYLLSWLLLIGIYFVIPKDKKPSSIFLQLHFIIMFIPKLTIYAFMNQSTRFLLLCIGIFVLQCILVKLIPNVKIAYIKNSKNILYFSSLAGITIFVYASMIIANGVPDFTALNLLDVYYVRGNVVHSFSMSYLATWQERVINPLFITMSYFNKKWKLLIVSIGLHVLIFMITANKATFFIPIAIVVVSTIYKKNDFFLILSKIAIAGIIGSLVFYQMTQNILLPSLFLRRFLFIPAQLRFFYYDFFSQNEFLYFSEGIVGLIFGTRSPYDMPSSVFIPILYIGNEGWGNTGYLADAYANMGVLGMLILSSLLVFIFKLTDSLALKINPEVVIGISLFSVLALNDGALLTTLLTRGWLFLLFALYLYPASDLQKPTLAFKKTIATSKTKREG